MRNISGLEVFREISRCSSFSGFSAQEFDGLWLAVACRPVLLWLPLVRTLAAAKGIYERRYIKTRQYFTPEKVNLVLWFAVFGSFNVLAFRCLLNVSSGGALMISFEHKFIFIHVPKTAGNSVQAALSPFCSDRLVLRPSNGSVEHEDGVQGLDVFNEQLGFTTAQHKHATLDMYYEQLGDEINNFFVFLCVRNPWDRLVSQTCFRHKDRLPETYLKREDIFWPKPILPFVEVLGDAKYDAVIRFENLQEDFDKVCERLGFGRIQLPHKNKSRRGHYGKYISREVAKEVSVRYASDIEEFGYRFVDI